MEDIIIKIKKELIVKKLRELTKMEDLEVELLGDTFRVVLKVGALVFKMPISISIRLLETQKKPEDPIVFEIIANPMVKAIIKRSKVDSRGVKIVDSYVRIYPSEIFSFMKNFTVDDVEFADDYVALTLSLHEG